MQGRTLMSHDGRQFYCWKHDRWFDALKLPQCYWKGCTRMYEHTAAHRRREKREKRRNDKRPAGTPAAAR